MKKYIFHGKEYTVKELVELSKKKNTNVGYDAMLNRLRKGWSVADAVNVPLHAKPAKQSKELYSMIDQATQHDGQPLSKQAKRRAKVILDKMFADIEKENKY